MAAGIEEEKVSLATLKGGAAIEVFDMALQRVLDNINDPNTKPSATREVTLKVTIKPSEDRGSGAIAIACSSKLASIQEVGTVLYFGKDEMGDGAAFEFNARQPELFRTVNSNGTGGDE